jgi:hypothetical protein
MTKENVIELGNFKDFKETRQLEKNYESYLKSLENSQLEIEVSTLLNGFSDDRQDKNYFSRGQMILKEIRSRAHASVKRKIDQLTDLRLL